MNLFFDSVEDYAFNLQGPIVDAELLKSTLKHFSSMDGDDVYTSLEAGDAPSDSMDDQEDEYREDRYEQMASLHHCWRI